MSFTEEKPYLPVVTLNSFDFHLLTQMWQRQYQHVTRCSQTHNIILHVLLICAKYQDAAHSTVLAQKQQF